jgi:hypothetical protein
MKRIIRILPLMVLAIFCVKAQAQTIVLDDFSGPRVNSGTGENLIEVYNVYDPGQTYSIGNGKLQVTGSPSNGIYWHFLPYPYTGTKGFTKGWIASGTWDANVNRLNFSFSCNANISKTSRGYGNFQLGTYVKKDDADASYQGAHFYHLLDPNVYSGKVVYVSINRTPQHQVGQSPSTNWPENPTASSVNYFDGLTRWYFDTQDGSSDWSSVSCQFTPVTFEKKSGEPDQQVSSVTYQYTGSRYEVTWSGPKNSTLKFDIAYSASSMKTAGFSSGIPAGTISATGNDYTNVIWASANMQEAAIGLYVAIRPQGQAAFTEVFIPNSSGGTTPPPPVASTPATPTNLTIN